MKHLANISQFEQLQAAASGQNWRVVRNDNESGHMPESYRELRMGTGAGNVMGSNKAPGKPNTPRLPEWGARNSLGDILLSLQERLIDYFRRTQSEKEKFLSDVDKKTEEVGVFLDVVKHPAARQRLGLSDEHLKIVSEVVKDFYASFKQQIYDVVYRPLADSCDQITAKIEAEGNVAPTLETGFGWFGMRPTLRSEFKRRLKEALKKGTMSKDEYKFAKRDRSEEGLWGRERAEYEKYRTRADELLDAQREGGVPLSPGLKKVMEWYGYNVNGSKGNGQGEYIPEDLRVLLGQFADIAAGNEYFSTMGTPEWPKKNSNLLGKIRSKIPASWRSKKKGNDSTTQQGGTGSDKQQGANVKGAGKNGHAYIDIPPEINMSLKYKTPEEFINSEGLQAAAGFLSDLNEIKNQPENKGKWIPDRLHKFAGDLRKALKNQQ